MNTIHSVISMLDAHQGSCMVLLTIALVVCSLVSCIIAAISIWLMRKLDAKRSSPYVVVETTQCVPFFGVRLVNMGLTTARNVTVETRPQMRIAFPSYQKPIGFLDNSLHVVVPQKSYSCDIGSWDQIKKDCPSMVYRCTVRYESEWGEKYESEYALDYSVYEHLIHRDEKTLTDLTKKFEDFCREFHSLVTGFYKPHVLTEDYDAYEAKVERAMEERMLANKTKSSSVTENEEA